jgi:hypothetical protein
MMENAADEPAVAERVKPVVDLGWASECGEIGRTKSSSC